MLTNTCNVCGDPQLGVHYHEREEVQTIIWVCGRNMVGYLPESEPYMTTDWESARQSIGEDISNHIDSLYDGLTTYKYFESGREEWTALKILQFAEQYEDSFPCYVMDGQWEIVLLTDRDKEILNEMARNEMVLESLNECEPDTEWGDIAEYTSYWINTISRGDAGIPDDIEDDELEEFIQQLNERCY